MNQYKMTLACLAILVYILFNYYYDKKRDIHGNESARIFEAMLLNSIVCSFLDLTTVYTVNHLETVPAFWNRFFHLCFLISIDLFIFLTYIYMLAITDIYPKSRREKTVIFLPFIINVVVVIATIPLLEYRIGKVTNYSMGIPAYTCYIMVIVYVGMAIYTFIRRWQYINANKRTCIAVSLVVFFVIMVIQMLFPETLISELAITITVLCMYITMENAAVKKLNGFQKESVVAFSDVIESRDGSTGEHVKRTTAYVQAIVKGLQTEQFYKDVLTRDYTDHLLMAAPMHDIGKIGVPDSILQKPGRLTEEEFAKMKEHTVIGKEIIEEALGKIENQQYVEMARDVAWCHHERWDGTGYPRGISGTDIPLSARIMAVADVFDAVSQHRCYRKAMSMEQSFAIIEEGKGTQFDPQIVEMFLALRPEIEMIHKRMNEVSG